MKHVEVSMHWDHNAEIWQKASDAGYDILRDELNTPSFLAELPDISNLHGIDIGCGEGHNSRLIATRCRLLTAIDISEKFIAANSRRKDNPPNLAYRTANANELPFPNESIDFVVATMAFMDVAELDKVLQEIHRILKPSGFLQFSITHPCFNSYLGQWQFDEQENPAGFLIKDYFKVANGEIHEWQHRKSPISLPKFKVPRFIRPLSSWIDLLVQAKFKLDKLVEPRPSLEQIMKYPELKPAAMVAHSLIIRCVKDNYQDATLDKIIEKLPGNVWWKGKDLKYLGCNQRVLDVLGLESKHEFIGKTDFELWDKAIAEKLLVADLDVLEKGQVINLEETILQKNGSPAIMLTNKSPLYDDLGNIIGVVGTSTDISLRKKAEEDLKLAKEQAESTDQLKTEFIRNMEHDIRTPFSGIYSLLQIIAEEDEDKERKALLQQVSMSAKGLLDYCNSILDFSRIESGSLAILNNKFELKGLIASVEQIEIVSAISKKLTFKVKYDEAIPTCIIGDDFRLKRILLNLLSNAIKFTHTGIVELTVKMARQIDERHVVVQFIISDTGIGIPKSKQAIVFEPFVRLDPSHRNHYAGQGLGLSIVKRFMDELNGDIEIVSEKQKGTQFICNIPFKLPLV